jgi:hypothetical protein
MLVTAILGWASAPIRAQIPPDAGKRLEPVFIEAKAEFYGMIGKILQNHPLKSQLGAAELGKVLKARQEIPFCSSG